MSSIYLKLQRELTLSSYGGHTRHSQPSRSGFHCPLPAARCAGGASLTQRQNTKGHTGHPSLSAKLQTRRLEEARRFCGSPQVTAAGSSLFAQWPSFTAPKEGGSDRPQPGLTQARRDQEPAASPIFGWRGHRRALGLGRATRGHGELRSRGPRRSC